MSSQVALLFDWNAWWAADLDSHPSELVRYMDAPLALHRALWRQGIGVDVVHPGADLSGYRVVVVPTLYLVDDDAAGQVRDFVAGGGHAVVTYFSGIVDQHDHVRLGGYPGAFADLLGVRTEEFFPLAPNRSVVLDPAAGATTTGSWTGSVWTELTHLRGAPGAGDLPRRPGGRAPGAHPARGRHRHRLVPRHGPRPGRAAGRARRGNGPGRGHARRSRPARGRGGPARR